MPPSWSLPSLLHQAPVAQWIEHWPPEPGVSRSNRDGRTMGIRSAGVAGDLTYRAHAATLEMAASEMRAGSSGDRAPPCGGGGPAFKSRPACQSLLNGSACVFAEPFQR